MSDEAESVIPMPTVRPVAPINRENAAEMAHRKADKERERRATSNLQARARANHVVSSAADQAMEAADNSALDKKSIEELADLNVRRMANVMLLGGMDFMPASPREVSDIATAWASIAYKEAQKRKGAPSENEEETPVEATVRNLVKMKRDMERRAKKPTG